HPENFIIENALYQSWLLTQRSGENGFRVSRSSATETEPNDDMSSANAVSTDTVSAYLTAYDEDWYSITVTGGGDWTLETHATTADDNAGDTKLYLYAANSSADHIAYNDDESWSNSYSKISHRFEDAVTPTNNLFFSEYAEGSSNNKYLEIYNGTGADVSLDQYVIMGNYNGNPWSEAFTFAAGATIENGGVYVIANASASSEIQAQADELLDYGDPWYTASFNGDDVRALAQISGSDTTIIDIIGTLDGDGDGVPGEGSEDDPGSGFDVAGTSAATKDYTLVRKGSVLSGNSSWSASAGTSTSDSEWEVADRPTASYTPSTLGSHTITADNEYFVKVTGYSGTYAGAYLLTAVETPFNANMGTLVINELHYNPASGLEFVELHNTGSAAIDLSGHTWSGITHTFASGSSIAAGGYALADSLTSGSLSDDGETLELLDSTGALVDVVTYDDASPWPTGADGGGPPLELIDASADNDDASNWRGWGITGGTPGAANSAQPDVSMGASITSYQ
ncbi:MAG: lamin tail domain-containing protein, partial [Gammaproteobacteria bacterium]|nr:lamin tail domain-containing protein [Gammaproteobacteria bacterium]